MIAVIVVLGVAAVAALGFAVQRSITLRAARGQIKALELVVADKETEIAATNQRADVSEAKATKAIAAAAAANKSAAESDREATDAAGRAAAESERADAEFERADAEVQRADSMTSRAEVAEEAVRMMPADGLWGLEASRVSRVWRDRVSVTLDGRSPVPGAPDEAEAATRVLAEASREESGVVVDVVWKIDPPPEGSQKVMIVRVAEELIAAAWPTDGADLMVSATEAAVELRLRTEPPIHASAELAEALHACGADVSSEGDAILVRLPRALSRQSE